MSRAIVILLKNYYGGDNNYNYNYILRCTGVPKVEIQQWRPFADAPEVKETHNNMLWEKHEQIQ